jgi:hypothetical protein
MSYYPRLTYNVLNSFAAYQCRSHHESTPTDTKELSVPGQQNFNKTDFN